MICFFRDKKEFVDFINEQKELKEESFLLALERV